MIEELKKFADFNMAAYKELKKELELIPGSQDLLADLEIIRNKARTVKETHILNLQDTARAYLAEKRKHADELEKAKQETAKVKQELEAQQREIEELKENYEKQLKQLQGKLNHV